MIFAYAVCSAAQAAQPQLEDHFREGQQAFEQRDYQRAITEFEKAVEIDPDSAAVYNALGLAHQAAGSRLTDIIWFFNVATELDPEYIEAYDNLCKVYYEAKDFEKAEKTCLQALRINPSFGSAELSLAWIYLTGKNQPYDAIHYFQRVLAKVENPTVYFGLGMAYSLTGDHARVLETVTTLRTLGANELATQLENSIRSAETSGPEPGPAETILPQRSKGTIIEARPEPVVSASPSANPAPVSGQMRIRLKGKLFGSPED